MVEQYLVSTGSTTAAAVVAVAAAGAGSRRCKDGDGDDFMVGREVPVTLLLGV